MQATLGSPFLQAFESLALQFADVFPSQQAALGSALLTTEVLVADTLASDTIVVLAAFVVACCALIDNTAKKE